MKRSRKDRLRRPYKRFNDNARRRWLASMVPAYWGAVRAGERVASARGEDIPPARPRNRVRWDW